MNISDRVLAGLQGIRHAAAPLKVRQLLGCQFRPAAHVSSRGKRQRHCSPHTCLDLSDVERQRLQAAQRAQREMLLKAALPEQTQLAQAAASQQLLQRWQGQAHGFVAGMQTQAGEGGQCGQVVDVLALLPCQANHLQPEQVWQTLRQLRQQLGALVRIRQLQARQCGESARLWCVG